MTTSYDVNSIDTALRHMAYGVYIVTTRNSQGDHGVTASWVMQVSKNPPMIAVSLQASSNTAKVIGAAKIFAVNLLSADAVEMAEKFITPVDRFASLPQPVVTRGTSQAPLLGEAMGWLECKVKDTVEAGDHMIFIGEVVAGELKQSAMPLTTLAAGMGYGGVA